MSSLFEQNPGLVKSLLSDSGYDTGILDGLYAGYVDAGYTGSLEDMAYDALGDIGYTGSLSDRWAAALADGLLGVVLVNYALGSSSSNVVSPLISTTRTSSATITQTDGTLTTVPADTPAIDGLTLATTVAEGAQLGPELVTSWDFSSSDGWGLETGYTISGGQLFYTNTNRAYQQIPELEGGPGIRVQVVVDTQQLPTSGTTRIDCYGVTQEITSTGTTTFEGVTTHTLNLYVNNGGSGAISGTGILNSISVKAVLPTYLDTNNTVSSSLNTKYGKSKTYVEDVGLHVEGSATNLLSHSEEFDNAVWVMTKTTVSANAVTAPDETLTADKLIEAALAGVHTTHQLVPSAVTGTYTTSVYIKDAGDGRYLQIRPYGVGAGAFYATVDPSNGAVTESAGANLLSVSTKLIANGWYRVSVTANASLTAGSDGIQYVLSNSGTGGEAPSYTGDGTSGVYMWGAQFEAGSYASSYIPTTTAPAARAAATNLLTDAAGTTLTPADIGWTPDEIFSEITVTPDAGGQSSQWIISTQATVADNVSLYILPANVVLRKRIASVDSFGVFGYTHAAGTPFTVRLFLSTIHGLGLSVNGGAWQTDADTTAAVLGSTVEVGSITGAAHFAGHYKLGSEIGMTKAQAEKRWGDLPWQ